MLWPSRSTSFLAIATFVALIVLATSSASGSTSSRVLAHASADASGWTTDASAFRGQNGSQFTYDCPSFGTEGTVIGTDTYDDTSSVCTAAVHVGLITVGAGGTVTIQIGPDAGSYTGSTRNGVTSDPGGADLGSFTVVSAVQNQPPVTQGGSGWVGANSTATQFAQWIGAEYTYTCPKGGPKSAAWGNAIYSGDSSVCTAGLHSGVASLSKNEIVTIQIVPEQPSYSGSTKNGVTTSPFSAKPGKGAFVVIGATDGPDTPQGVATGTVLINGQPFQNGPVPYNSTIDVTGGTLTLAAGGVGSVITFGDGSDTAVFKLNKVVNKITTGKGKKKKTIKQTTAELALQGGNFGACSAFRAFGSAVPAGKNVRSLWASGKGRFRTKGKYSSASIRGTKWQTTDRCDGTLTTVAEGAVTVHDNKLNKNVTVSAPNSYLAKA
jgi:hypothetical protein